MAQTARSRQGPSPAQLAVLAQGQRDLAEDRYQLLLAAVQHKYRIAPTVSGPRQLHEVSFAEYTDRDLETVEADMDPRRGMKGYIEALHEMFRSNVKTLEGDIMYTIAEPQCWAFIDYYHSSAGTTGRNDWDSMFASLRITPRRAVVPCMFASTPFGCHISKCPFRHPPSSDIAAARSTLVEARRTYLRSPTERNRYTFIRETSKNFQDGENHNAIKEESTTLGAICDNGLCARKARVDGQPLLTCSGCGWARYCSTECQKLCRKRHKQVCVKVELLIEEDSLWTMEGIITPVPGHRRLPAFPCNASYQLISEESRWYKAGEVIQHILIKLTRICPEKIINGGWMKPVVNSTTADSTFTPKTGRWSY